VHGELGAVGAMRTVTLSFPAVADRIGEFLREFSLFNSDDKSTQTISVTMRVVPGSMSSVSALVFDERRGDDDDAAAAGNRTTQVRAGEFELFRIVSNCFELFFFARTTQVRAGEDAHYLVFPMDEYGNRLQVRFEFVSNGFELFRIVSDSESRRAAGRRAAAGQGGAPRRRRLSRRCGVTRRWVGPLPVDFKDPFQPLLNFKDPFENPCWIVSKPC
jgi:hypothetical protein